MLFDLRSPGRRRLIKTVYLFLAILIGVGLIGFGVGTGGNFGGLFSAAASGSGTRHRAQSSRNRMKSDYHRHATKSQRAKRLSDR